MSEGVDGKVWVPTGPGERHEPVVGPGVPVWSVIGYLKLFNWDVDRVVDEFERVVTYEDVKAAWEYYELHKEEVDTKLRLNEVML